MTYLIQNKKRNLRNFFTSKSLIILVTLIVMVLIFFGVLSPLFIKFVSYVSLSVNNAPVFEYFKTKKAIVSDNIYLRNQVNELLALNINQKALQSENERLNEILDRVDTKDRIIAKVIRKPGFSPYDVVYIDAGTNREVEIDDLVYFGNIAIGRVFETSSQISKVRLFSSPGNTFSAIIGDTRYEVTAKGIGGGGFEVLVPKGIQIEVNDTIILPEVSSKVFGVVSNIQNEPEDVFQNVHFSLPISLFEIDFVNIEK